MTLFRILLSILIVTIYATTLVTMSLNGADFLTAYFSALVSGTWQGQFNLDFGMYLVLSALWIMWRGGFGASVVMIGLAAGLLGMLVFAPYVLWISYKERGDVQQIFLGVHAGAGRTSGE